MKLATSAALPMIGFLIIALLQLGAAQLAPSPAPASSDGTAIDQGVAYVLLGVALAITYLVH